MPIYPFSCGCGQESSTHRNVTDNTLDKTCPTCGEAMNRRFSVAFHRFEEHFNPAVGHTVSSKRQFREDLKRASEAATLRTGIPHSYVPVDIEKKDTPGTESQAREHRKLGTPGFERKRSYH